MTSMYWYNFDTEEYDYIEAPEDFAPYIPKGAAQNLYRVYVAMGESHLDAANKVLTICVDGGK